MPIRLKPLIPAEAVDFFAQKGYRIGFDHRDVWQAEHQAAFTVAKAMQVDLLADIRAEVEDAIANGTSFEAFRDALKPKLVQRGWWGRALMTDPVTGEQKDVQLGSTRRLKTIYDTNLRTAHSEEQWVRIQQAKGAMPYLMYDHTPSAHERKEHAAWDGLVLPVDDPWWQAHYPVRAYGCKCGVIQLGQRQVDRMGLTPGAAPAEEWRDYTNRRTGETQRIPVGVDPGFAYPPGGRRANLARMLADKVERAPAAVGAPVFGEAAATVMPALMQDYTRWALAVEAGGGRGLGGRRVVGALTEAAIAALGEAGVDLATAAVSVEQRELTHLFAEARKGAKAVPREVVYGLPEKLRTADAVLYDGRPGAEAILYVWKRADGRYVRIAVRPNFRMKGSAYTNAVRSAHLVERDNLSGKYFRLLDGKL